MLSMSCGRVRIRWKAMITLMISFIIEEENNGGWWINNIKFLCPKLSRVIVGNKKMLQGFPTHHFAIFSW